MLPFCGYNMGDYWQHWLDVGTKLTNPPKIFNVNWFRLDDGGNFIWPGYGDNFRVIDWIVRRCNGEVDARETAIGYTPRTKDIEYEDIDYYIHAGRRFNLDALRAILTVESVYWKETLPPIKEFYAQFGDRLPQVLMDELTALEARLWLV